MRRLEQRSRGETWPLGLAAVGFLALSGVAALLPAWLNPKVQPAPWSISPPIAGTAGYAHSFAELLSEPDLIVEGVVDASGPGRTVGDGPSALQFTQTTLRVASVHSGTYAGDSVIVETDLPFETEWREPGTRVLAFLWQKRDDESAGRYYRLISPEGVAIVDGSVLRPVLASEVSAPLRGANLDDIVAKIDAANKP
jgi:hypothetical protein